MALAMAKQSRGYQIHLDCKHIRGKQVKTRVKKEKNIDFIQITMKEKTYLHQCHPQYKLALIPP